MISDVRMVEERETWDEYFMGLARKVAARSKDRSHKVGAVIVTDDHRIRSTGYNGFPRGVNDDDAARHERPVKYMYTEHAERNAIYQAEGVRGCTMYVAGLLPCAECARAIIQSGIVMVVCVSGDIPERWQESVRIGALMLAEAGVRVFTYADGVVGREI